MNIRARPRPTLRAFNVSLLKLEAYGCNTYGENVRHRGHLWALLNIRRRKR